MSVYKNNLHKGIWTQAQLEEKLATIRAAYKNKRRRFSFSGSILCNLEFRDIVLHKVEFVGCNMSGCRFVNVNFSECRFGNTCMVGVRVDNVTGISRQTPGIIFSPKKEAT